MKEHSTREVSRWIAAVGAVWIVLALPAGQARFLKTLPVPAIPILILTLAGVILLAFWTLPTFHDWS